MAFSVASGVTIEIIPYLISAISYWVLIMFALINLVMLVPIYLFYIGEFDGPPHPPWESRATLS